MRLLLWQSNLMNQLRFREKLTPPIWAWVALTGFCLTLAISVSAVFGTEVALFLFLALLVFFTFIGHKFSPIIKVDVNFLYANKAKLPLSIITKATPLSISETTKLRGVNSDPRAFSATSPLIRTAIKIDFSDKEDPHTYWIVSTRKAAALSQVLSNRD